MRGTRHTLALSSILTIALASGSVLFAQDTAGTPQDQSGQQMQHSGGWHHGPMSPDQELAHMTKALNLSSDQQAQLKPVLQDRHDQLMQLHQDSSLSREDRMSKIKALDADSNSKVLAVLNDQQKTKYNQMVADRQEHRQEMRQNHGEQGPGAEPQQ